MNKTSNVALSWEVTAHARRLLGLGVAGLVAAVLTSRPAFVALAAPALVLLASRPAERPGTIGLSMAPSAVKVFEGEQVAIEVVVEAGAGVLSGFNVELALHPAEGIAVVGGPVAAIQGRAVLAYEAQLWGRRVPGTLEVVVTDRHGLGRSEAFVVLPRLSCYPAPSPYRRPLALGRLLNRSGDHTSRSSGEGSEFTGVRHYVPGDRQRSINWGATTRRGRLQVNTFAAERSQDIVLVVDASGNVGQVGSTPLDHALRGALGVARTYLAARDRVGMVFLGGRMRWLAPGLGQRQFFRMAEVMLEGSTGWSTGADLNRLPRAALPPGAAVICFSPLLDTRVVEMLADLRQRNFSVTVVDVLNTSPGFGKSKNGAIASRIWRLHREATLFALRELGTGLAQWDGQEELALPQDRPRKAWGNAS